MKCTKCKGKAIIKLPQHNARFCKTHFEEYFLNQVKKAVKKYKMIGKDEKVLVAVSGGKDSLVLWEVLHRLGYNAEGFYIDLGIEEYSRHSLELCRDFADSRNLQLNTVSLPGLTGYGIREISQKTRRTPCSACGLIKRYLFNRLALERGYQVIATGHNLDDEAATLMGNITRWQTNYLSRQSPVLPSNHPSMVKKIKPLCRLTEKETSSFAVLNGINYIYEECPLAEGARSILYKKTLNYLENNSPGTKIQFYLGFLKQKTELFPQESETDLSVCRICHQPTTLEVCAFCNMMEKLGLEKITL